MPEQPSNVPIAPTPALTNADLVARQKEQAEDQKILNALDQQQLQKQSEKSLFKRIYNKQVQKGSLIVFQYSFYKHDPFPLCLVGKMWPDGMISGLNLHYLTFKYTKYLTQVYCGKMFHYGLIKGNKYIVNSYRSYKREGRKQVKTLDCDFVNSLLKTARSFKPNEIEAMRQQIQKQLQAKLHPTADQIAKEYQESIFSQSHKDYDIGREQPSGRFNPTDILEP